MIVYVFVPAPRESRRDFFRKYAGGTLLGTLPLSIPAAGVLYDKI